MSYLPLEQKIWQTRSGFSISLEFLLPIIIVIIVYVVCKYFAFFEWSQTLNGYVLVGIFWNSSINCKWKWFRFEKCCQITEIQLQFTNFSRNFIGLSANSQKSQSAYSIWNGYLQCIPSIIPINQLVFFTWLKIPTD